MIAHFGGTGGGQFRNDRWRNNRRTEPTRVPMMTKAYIATAIAAVASPAIATVEESTAAPLTVGATVMAPAATEVQYRTYFDDDYKSVSKVE